MTRRCTKGAGPRRSDPLSVSSLLELVLETGGNLGRLVLGDLNDLLDVFFADSFLGLLEAFLSLLLQIFQTHVSSLKSSRPSDPGGWANPRGCVPVGAQ